MQSIINALQSEEIARIRIGVAPDDPRKGGAKYILAPFRKSMLKPLDEALDLAAQAVQVIVNDGILKAMSNFNRKNKPEDSEEKV
jgi:PTH1 family peptidyl-tRNA hydrolase